MSFYCQCDVIFKLFIKQKSAITTDVTTSIPYTLHNIYIYFFFIVLADYPVDVNLI